MPTNPIAAIVVYQGVLVDETEVFRFVLSRLPGVRTVTVGVARGQVAGPGGVEVAEATLAEVTDPEIVAVPGGMGCHRQTAIAAWLQSVSPRWTLSSSTGSALLATADLLRDATAATHWLAGSILERHGAHPSREQVVVDGSIVSSSGRSSAFRAALVVAQTYGGPSLVEQILTDAASAREPAQPLGAEPWWLRMLRTLASRPAPSPAPAGPLLDEGEVLDLGLVGPERGEAV